MLLLLIFVFEFPKHIKPFDLRIKTNSFVLTIFRVTFVGVCRTTTANNPLHYFKDPLKQKTLEMYIPCIRLLLFIVLTISWLERGSCNAGYSNSYSSNNLLLDELTKSCPSDGIPVCGIRHNKQYVIFPNECLLQEVNKDILEGVQST